MANIFSRENKCFTKRKKLENTFCNKALGRFLFYDIILRGKQFFMILINRLVRYSFHTDVH